MPTTERTSEELALAVQRGSADCFTELVERFQGPLYNFLVVRLRSVTDAEELTQEALVRAWRKIDYYKPEWRFSTWLFTVARHIAVSHQRSVRARPRQQSDEVPLAEVGDGADPVRDLSRREETSRVWRLAADVLTRDQRSALWLRYAEDLTPKEIGRVLGRHPGTVRVLLFRARERLARRLAPARRKGGRPLSVNATIAGGG